MYCTGTTANNHVLVISFDCINSYKLHVKRENYRPIGLQHVQYGIPCQHFQVNSHDWLELAPRHRDM
jgi:hypothetical protein